MSVNADIRSAVVRGHPTSDQRKRWTQVEWDAYEAATACKQDKEREAYERSNSPERLRELIADLQLRVERLENPHG